MPVNKGLTEEIFSDFPGFPLSRHLPHDAPPAGDGEGRVFNAETAEDAEKGADWGKANGTA